MHGAHSTRFCLKIDLFSKFRTNLGYLALLFCISLHLNSQPTVFQVKTHRKHKVLGILDIYGFEAFQQNGFEQFIINFANEKLQQVFIDCLLKQEQEEYLAEGVEWTQVGFFSNAVICHLIEQGSHGIFTQLDEASVHLPTRQNGANSSNSLLDEDFLEHLNSSLCSHPHYEPPGPASGRDVAKEANPVPAHSFRYNVLA